MDDFKVPNDVTDSTNNSIGSRASEPTVGIIRFSDNREQRAWEIYRDFVNSSGYMPEDIDSKSVKEQFVKIATYAMFVAKCFEEVDSEYDD